MPKKASSTHISKSSPMKKKKSQSFSKRNRPEILNFLSRFRSEFRGGREVIALRAMAGATQQQSRLVKCPDCKTILQEPEDVPAYKCGGCDTVLLVKTRKTDRKAESISYETQAAEIGLSSGECSSDQNNEICQNEHIGSITKQPGYYDLEPSTSRDSFQSTDFLIPHRDYYYDGRRTQFKDAYIHERSGVLQETPRRDKFPTICDSEMHLQASNMAYGMYSRPIRNWINKGRDYYMSPNCFSPTSPSTSALFECSSPFHPSYVSTPGTPHGRSYHRSYGRLGLTNETNFSQMQFMVGTPERRYLQAVGQSPLPAILYQGKYSHNFYSSYCSGAATSQECQYTGYHSNVKTYTPYHEFNGHIKESTKVLKRHLHPTKGGAPFVTCYYCLEVLQVPQGSLASKKKLHLQCGRCCGVLKFLRRDGTCTVVPYTPLVLDSLPSRRSDTSIKDIDLPLIGNGSEDGGAISCSDDDGGSYFSRGCSIDRDFLSLEKSNNPPINTEKNSLEVTTEIPDLYLKKADYKSEVSREPLRWNEMVGEMSGVYLGKPENNEDKRRVASKLDETVEDGIRVLDERSETSKPNETTGDGMELNWEESGTQCENPSENFGAGELIKHKDKQLSHLEEVIKDCENSSELDWGETEGEKTEFLMGEVMNEKENSCEKQEADGNVEERLVFHSDHIRSESEESSEQLELGENAGKELGIETENSSEKLEVGEILKEKPVTDLEEIINEFETSVDKLEPGETMEERMTLNSREIKSESGNSSENLELSEPLKEEPEHHFGQFVNDCEILSDKLEPGETMEERSVFHSKLIRNESENSSEKLELGENLDEKPESCFEESENEHETSNNNLEPSETVEEQQVFNSKHIRSESENTSDMLELGESLDEKPGSCFEEFKNDHETSDDKLETSETREEQPVFHSKHIRSECENSSEELELGESLHDKPESFFEEFKNDHETSYDKLEPSEATEEQPVFHSKHIRSESENSSKELEFGEIQNGKPVPYFREFTNDHEASIGTLEPSETMEKQTVFHLEEMRYDSENSSKKLEFGENLDKKPVSYSEEFINDHKISNDKLDPGETMEEQPVFHSKHIRNESENSSEVLELGDIKEEKPGSCFLDFIDDHETSIGKLEPCETMEEKMVFHLEEMRNENDNPRENVETIPSKTVGDRPALHLDEYENKKGNSSEPFKLDETVGKNSMFDLEESENERDDSNESLDMEEVAIDTSMFQMELSQEVQEGPGETLESDKAKSGKTMEDSLSFHFERSLHEKDSSAETYEPYNQFHETVDPSVVVGLRQALYPTQDSPLRSPFASPLHSPIGSPIRYPKGSSLHSPIVSPFRSPTGSPTSNGLAFFSK